MADHDKTEAPVQVADDALDAADGGAILTGPSTDLEERGFNPQPEPPAKEFMHTFDPNGGLKASGFNPQPEPPPMDWIKSKFR